MLALPKRGFSRSVNQQNVQLDALCDWLEGGVLFQKDEVLSASDVVDQLMENAVYESQAFAWERIEDAWTELRVRRLLLGKGYPIEISPTRLRRIARWQDIPAHSFCLALSFAEWFPDWANSFGKDYTEQGELFETLTSESLQITLSGWEVQPTGWTSTKAQKLREVVVQVAGWLNEPETGTRVRWTKPYANEAGLDLLCFLPMPDRRPGVPIYLVQCASGVPSSSIWGHKLRTPDVRVWAKLIDFAVWPKRAFATPFSFLEDDFRMHCLSIDGILFDRYRLLAPSRNNDSWLSNKTSVRIRSWVRSRIKTLPTVT